jgi:hypothetical protein
LILRDHAATGSVLASRRRYRRVASADVTAFTLAGAASQAYGRTRAVEQGIGNDASDDLDGDTRRAARLIRISVSSRAPLLSR